MESLNQFKNNLHSYNAKNFDSIALNLFKIQANENKVYGSYLAKIGVDPVSVQSVDDIPFLPISFFKTHEIKTGEWNEEVIFTSSGTTGLTTSRHFVKDANFYLKHSEQIFNHFFGALYQFHFFALLPSYLEREGSSLVAMADYFIKQSKSPHSGFFLNNRQELINKIKISKNDDRKILLLGVSFALLELAELGELDLSKCMVMETGGMKGRRKEIIRDELHQFLCSRFNVSQIASEYGMTELFSQAYSTGGGYYHCPQSMKILIRDVYDPFEKVEHGRIGLVKVIDLANIDSCAFIETQDLGRMKEDGSFEIVGRLDNSDSRGCNLMM